MRTLFALAFCLVAMFVVPAQAARGHHHYRHHQQVAQPRYERYASLEVWQDVREDWPNERRDYRPRGARSHARYNDGRPRAWCGWWMRHEKGVSNPDYNLAANWRHWGQPSAPVVGAVVVYPHHVAEIVGACDGRGCIMRSGNDGHAVRTRYRSLRGAIAIRA
jgi:hypothetical protein